MGKKARMNKHGEKEKSNRNSFFRDANVFTSVYMNEKNNSDLCFSNFVLSLFFYYYYYCNFFSYYFFFLFLFSFSSH